MIKRLFRKLQIGIKHLLPLTWLKKLTPRQRLFFWAGIGALLIFAVPLIIAELFFPKGSKAAWFDENFLYRQPITVTVTASSSATINLETLLTIDTSTPIAAGKMQTSCVDMRFTNQGGDVLPYYLDSGCNSSSTKVWVMVDNIPANTTEYTLFFYYGNQQAKSVSDSTLFTLFRGLVGYWKMNETSWNGTSGEVKDSSVKGNNGDAVSGAEATPSGKFNNAGFFDGTDEAVTIATTAAQLTTGMTISTWINPTAGGSTQNIFDNSNPWAYRIYRSGTTLGFQLSTDGGNTGYHGVAGALTAGEWQHVVGTFDGVNVALYVNGKQVMSEAAGTSTIQGANARWYLGTYGSGEYFNGRIDDVRVYNRALSASEIQQLYQNPGNIAYVAPSISLPATSFGSEEQSPSPVAYWSFDEGVGTVASSSASPNLLAQLINGPAWIPESQCISGSCLYFDGSNDYSNIGDQDVLDFGTGSFSVSVWFKSSSANAFAFEKKSGVSNAGYDLLVGGTGVPGVIQARAADGVDRVETSSTGWTGTNDNKWHYATMVLDRASQTLTLYGDGVYKSSSSSALLDSTSNTTSFQIGARNAANFLQGYIDELRVYPFALSASQVKANYNARGGINAGSNVLGATDNENLSNGLVGYWKMDEASWNGTSGEVIDSSGNSNNGTSVLGANASPSAKFGNAGYFAGIDERVQAPTSSSLTIPGAVTLSAWIYHLGGATDHAGIIVGRGTNAGVGTDDYAMELTSGGLDFNYYNGSTWYDATYGSVPIGVWTHVAISRDSAGASIKYYINGSLIQTANGIGSGGGYSNPVVIGADTQYLPDVSFFDGNIDEARIYNRELSPQEISQLYNFAPGPVGYWNFEEGQGSVVNDSSTYGNNGVWSGTGSRWTQGKYGKGGKFNGSNDGVVVSNFDYNVIQSGNEDASWTLSVWAKGPDNATTANVLLGRRGWNAGIMTWDGGYSFQIRNDATTLYSISKTISDINSSWHFLSAVYSNRSMTFYVDGVLVGTDTLVGTIYNYSTNLGIGEDGGGFWQYNGNIDEARVYNYARTPVQIMSDMQAGAPPVTASGKSALGYWKFDEGYGTTANNSGNGGSALKGTLTNMASPASASSGWSQNGKISKALSFDGSNDSVISAGTLTPPTSLTFSVWVNPDSSMIGYAGYPNIVSYGSDPGMYIQHTTSKPYIQATVGGVSAACVSSKVLVANTWQHLVGTYDYNGTSTTLKTYLNGMQVCSTTASGAPSQTPGFFYADLSSVYKGKMDEVKLYNYPLTAQDVKAEYNHGSSLVLGAFGMDSSGVASNSASAVYCVPGSTDTCRTPVGEWLFDNRGASSIADTSGNAHTGTMLGSTLPAWTNGKIGSALKYNGSTSYVSLSGTDYGITSNQATVEHWIYPTAINGPTQIISDSIYTPQTGGWQIYVNSSSLKCFSSDGSGYSANSFTYTFNNNTWYHIVCAFNGATTKAYVNGALIGSSTNTHPIINPNQVVYVGAGNQSGGPNAFFIGTIDQMRVYDYERSQAQVVWSYNNGKPVARWKLDECQGGVVNDVSGFGNTGTITIGSSGTQTTVGTCQNSNSAAAWYNGRSGKWNSSLNLDGTDDFVAVSDSSILGPASQMSWFAWVKGNSMSSTQSIIRKDSNDYVLATVSSKVWCEIGGGAVNSGVTLSNTQWYLLGCTYDGTTLKSFVNGTQQGSALAGGGADSNLSLYIGSANGSQKFNGQIDDVQIFNYALTAVQVRNLYNQNSAVRFGPATGTP